MDLSYLFIPAPIVFFVTARWFWRLMDGPSREHEYDVHVAAAAVVGLAFTFITPVIFPVLVGWWLTNRVLLVSRAVRWCLSKQFPGGPWSQSS